MTERDGSLVAAGALLGLAAVAVLAWSALLSGFAAAVVPVAALAAPVLAGRRPARLAARAVAVWLLAAPLLAGVPADQLEPRAWTAMPARLAGGVAQLAAPSVDPGGAGGWPLAGGLALAGTAWIAAAALARRRIDAAFAAGATPWVAAAVLHPGDTAVWQGAAVLLVGLLWAACRHKPAQVAVTVSVVVALASAIIAQAAAPRHLWLVLPGWSGQPPPPRLFQTEPTFGRLDDRRTGAPMLEIKAAKPALWRLQVLDIFDGHGWRASGLLPRLPEPAGKPVRVDVRVRGLRSDLVASPGPIERVEARGPARPYSGASWRLQSWPEAGDEYRVDARVVRADAGALRRARAPSDRRIAAYTQLGWPTSPLRRARSALPLWPLGLLLAARSSQPPGFPVDVPPFGDRRDPAATGALARSPYRGVAALARRLASGARTEWKVVARVIDYLRGGDRFRYTTDVGPPGRFPLADFLLHTHAGYCQHFAGAAALLLRLAGVPARLVAGFATGVRRSGRFEVRDVDAHDWIEVYFQGYGWVPFNPTPAVAPAAIAPGLDLLAPAGRRGPMLGWRAWMVLGVLAAVGLAGSRVRRRPRDLGDALARLVRTPSGPSTTLGELADQLARTVGPHTSALAAEAERDRFASPGAAQQRWTSARIARALARDVGPWRAALLLAGAASAGARSSQRRTREELA